MLSIFILAKMRLKLLLMLKLIPFSPLSFPSQCYLPILVLLTHEQLSFFYNFSHFIIRIYHGLDFKPRQKKLSKIFNLFQSFYMFKLINIYFCDIPCSFLHPIIYKSCYIKHMKCTRCCMSTIAIMCSSCYQENCKHNEEGRITWQQKYEEAAALFQYHVQQNLDFGNSLTLANRTIASMHSQRSVRDILQTRADYLKRKKKENQLLKQKINARKAYLLKLQRETNNLRQKVKEKVRNKDLMVEKTENICLCIKEDLQSTFGWLIDYLKVDLIACSKLQWEKFVNMEQESLNMYVLLMEGEYEEQLTKMHKQIQRQMAVLSSMSLLLGIPLPYSIDLKRILKSDSDSLLFMKGKEGKQLNKRILREFQANSSYLFSRFQISMEYPQIDCSIVNTLLAKYVQLKLKIMNYLNGEDLTQPIYISSQSMGDSYKMSRQSIAGDSIAVITSSLPQLSIEGLLQRYSLPQVFKNSLEDETTEEIDLTEFIYLSGFKSVGSSDEEVQILE